MILGAVITAASEAAASVDAPPGAPTQLVSTTKATVHAAAAIATHGEYNTLHASVRFTYCVPLTFHVFAGRGASLGAAPEAVLEAASVPEAGVTPTAPEGGGGAAWGGRGLGRRVEMGRGVCRVHIFCARGGVTERAARTRRRPMPRKTKSKTWTINSVDIATFDPPGMLQGCR